MIGNEGDAIIIAEDAERERLHVAVEDVVDDDLVLVVLPGILLTMLSHRLNTTKTVEGVFVIGNRSILPRFVQDGLERLEDAIGRTRIEIGREQHDGLFAQALANDKRLDAVGNLTHLLFACHNTHMIEMGVEEEQAFAAHVQVRLQAASQPREGTSGVSESQKLPQSSRSKMVVSK